VLASIIVVHLDVDPFKAVTKWSGISGIISDLGIPVILIRLLSIGLPIYFATIGVACWVVVTICLLHLTHEVLHYLNIYADEYLRRFNQTFFRKINLVSIQLVKRRLIRRDLYNVVSSVAMHRCITHHRQLSLLFTVVNKAYYYIFPCVGMLGIILIILTNYLSIRFYGIIPMPIYLGIPLYSVAIFIVMCLIFPVASGVHEFSARFLSKCKLVLSKDKYFLRRLYSEKPISFDCGQFFIFKRSTEKAMFLFIVEYTANSLILTR